MCGLQEMLEIATVILVLLLEIIFRENLFNSSKQCHFEKDKSQ